MIRLKNIYKSYFMGKQEVPVLHGINLDIHDGDFMAIIGASGSGKSTMMNIIGLLDRATSGECYIHDREVSTLTRDEQATLRNKTVGFIFQSFFLLPRLQAWQNVALPLLYRDGDLATAKQRAIEALAHVGMDELYEHRPNELSGGQQQRVAIARALVGDPTIILADEPTGALDSKTGEEVMNLLIDLNRNHAATVVIITHDMNIAKQCDRIVRVHDGLVVDEKM